MNEKLRQYVKRVVDEAPPITDEQRRDIRALFRSCEESPRDDRRGALSEMLGEL